MRRALPSALLLALVLAALASLLTSPADAQQRERSRGGWTGALARSEDPRLTGGWLFDHAVRRGLRARTPGARAAAATASDVLLIALMVAPAVTGAFHTFRDDGFPPAAGELALVHMEVQLGAFLSVTLIKNFVGRQRPYAWAVELDEACRDPARAQTLDCSLGRNESFFSGHAAASFAGAGLVCAQMAYLGVDAGWDVAACVAAATAAATTATLRIVADRHWTTDTIAGSLVGLAWGVLVPSLLHFGEGAPLPVARPLRSDERRSVAGMIAAGTGAGVLLAAVVPIVVALVGTSVDDPLVDVLADVRIEPLVGPALGLSMDGRF